MLVLYFGTLQLPIDVVADMWNVLKTLKRD